MKTYFTLTPDGRGMWMATIQGQPLALDSDRAALIARCKQSVEPLTDYGIEVQIDVLREDFTTEASLYFQARAINSVAMQEEVVPLKRAYTRRG